MKSNKGPGEGRKTAASGGGEKKGITSPRGAVHPTPKLVGHELEKKGETQQALDHGGGPEGREKKKGRLIIDPKKRSHRTILQCYRARNLQK